jgi:predicted amino acid dehydrogenase
MAIGHSLGTALQSKNCRGSLTKARFLPELKSRIHTAQQRAMQAVNGELVQQAAARLPSSTVHANRQAQKT